MISTVWNYIPVKLYRDTVGSPVIFLSVHAWLQTCFEHLNPEIVHLIQSKYIDANRFKQQTHRTELNRNKVSSRSFCLLSELVQNAHNQVELRWFS